MKDKTVYVSFVINTKYHDSVTTAFLNTLHQLSEDSLIEIIKSDISVEDEDEVCEYESGYENDTEVIDMQHCDTCQCHVTECDDLGWTINPGIDEHNGEESDVEKM